MKYRMMLYKLSKFIMVNIYLVGNSIAIRNARYYWYIIGIGHYWLKNEV